MNEDTRYEVGGDGDNPDPDSRPNQEPLTAWDGVERRRIHHSMSMPMTPSPSTSEPKLRLTLSTLAQIGLMLMTTGIVFAYLKSDVEQLKANQIGVSVMKDQNYQILLKVTELQTQMGAMRDEMKYYREKLDQEIQRDRQQARNKN
jgi:hypothetical protein